MLRVAVIFACLALPSQAGEKACPNVGKESEFPLKKLKEDFRTSMQKVVESDSGYKDFFTNEAMSCQMDCMEKAIDLGVLTLFLAGIDDDEQSVKSITGAIKTCFPILPRDEVMEFVKQIGDGMPTYHVPTARLYDVAAATHFGRNAGFKLGVSLPMLSFFVAAVLASFFMGRYVEKCRFSSQQEGGLLSVGPAE
mmetsp:Transcript_8146/g.22284  ORF Transcript_8146/g.22284 Transcript_8146/m.22284 type:complete len:195 (+) Transcript_8146:117-701(+)